LWNQNGYQKLKKFQSSGLKTEEMLPVGEIPVRNPSRETLEIWHTTKGS
jgi:hypothetical protein